MFVFLLCQVDMMLTLTYFMGCFFLLFCFVVVLGCVFCLLL